MPDKGSARATIVDPGEPLVLGSRRGRRQRPGTVTITFPHPRTVLLRITARRAPRPPVAERPLPRAGARRPGVVGAILGEYGLPRAATVTVSILAVVALTLTGDGRQHDPDAGATAADQVLPAPGNRAPGTDGEPADPAVPRDPAAVGLPAGTETSGSPSGVPLAVAANASPATGSPGASPTRRQVELPAAAPSGPLPATPTVGESAAPQQLASSGIPARARTAYADAAGRLAELAPACKLGWTLIAAIGSIESDHGRFRGSALGAASGRAEPPIYGLRLDGSNRGTAVIRDTDGGTLDADRTYDRAVGPMQFLPGTWRGYALDGDGDGETSPQDIDDAALTAGRYLCAGVAAGKDLSTSAGQWSAAYRYNRSTSYANLVLALSTTYATGKPAAVVNPPEEASTAVPTITITVTPVLPAVTTTRTLAPAATAPRPAPTSAAPGTAPTATLAAATATAPAATAGTGASGASSTSSTSTAGGSGGETSSTPGTSTPATSTAATSTAGGPGGETSSAPGAPVEVVTVTVTTTTVTVVGPGAG